MRVYEESERAGKGRRRKKRKEEGKGEGKRQFGGIRG